MRTNQYLGILLLLWLPHFALSSEAKVTVEAEWNLEKHQADSNAEQTWINASTWQERLEAELGLTKNGLGLSVLIEPENTSIEELYYENETNLFDYSLGLKEQEWAYAYSNSQLDWLDEERFALLEYYLSFGSGQLFCRAGDGFCGGRLSGWYDQWDFQLLAGSGKTAQFSSALQRQFGSGGVAYVEFDYQQKTDITVLEKLAPATYYIAAKDTEQWQSNAGIQWTTGFNLTILGEWVYRDTALDENDWDTIADQLKTESAGLVVDAFDDPFSQHTFLIRTFWQYDKVNTENVILYWPQAKHSLLNEFTVEYELNSVLTLAAEWQHAFKGSVLNRIGQGDTIALGVNFKDGW